MRLHHLRAVRPQRGRGLLLVHTPRSSNFDRAWQRVRQRGVVCRHPLVHPEGGSHHGRVRRTRMTRTAIACSPSLAGRSPAGARAGTLPIGPLFAFVQRGLRGRHRHVDRCIGRTAAVSGEGRRLAKTAGRRACCRVAQGSRGSRACPVDRNAASARPSSSSPSDWAPAPQDLLADGLLVLSAMDVPHQLVGRDRVAGDLVRTEVRIRYPNGISPDGA